VEGAVQVGYTNWGFAALSIAVSTFALTRLPAVHIDLSKSARYICRSAPERGFLVLKIEGYANY
jgi:hypothetical protein